nr:integrase, catalytic region, zinc finger, CCHC-type, peptidase aspartic, catalytic [Tanacetum cinerariifolium]
MLHLLSYDPEVLSEVPYSDSYPKDMINQDVQEMQYSEQTHLDDFEDNEIHSEHAAISVLDDEETLILEKESRSKMLEKQNDPILIEKKIKISLIDYSKLNKIKEDFGKRFALKKNYKNIFEIQIKQLWIDNDQLLNQIMSQGIIHIVANSVDILDVKKSCVNDCSKCLELETELLKKKDLIEKEAYDKLVKSYSNLEKHCISLKLATQFNQEIFQRENSGENLNAPTFNQLFEINELKAQSQEKGTIIRKLKEKIKSLSRKDSVDNVKNDIDEIDTINIELKHRVKPTTSAGRSKPSGNTKNNRIMRPPHSNQKSKVEDYHRKVKSSLNKTNSISEPINVPSSSSLVNDRFSRLFSEGVNLLSGSRDTILYTISLDDMLKTSPICLLLKASKMKSWLWHRRLSHLNFGTLNKLVEDGANDSGPGVSTIFFKVLLMALDQTCLLTNVPRETIPHHVPQSSTNVTKAFVLDSLTYGYELEFSFCLFEYVDHPSLTDKY